LKQKKRDLLDDLLSLPRNSAVRKVNEIVKRARLLRSHALILSHLKNKMPAIFGKDAKQKELIDNLETEFVEIQRIYKIPMGDFPNADRYKERLKDKNFSNFPKYSERLFNMLEEILSRDLPMLMNMVLPEKPKDINPFDNEWVISSHDKQVYDNIFHDLPLERGKLPGAQARQVLLDTGIPKQHLRQIWTLCDMEKQGALDDEEFALAMYLVEQIKKGKTIPEELTTEMIPPSKRY